MNVEIITKELKLEIYGFAGVALNKDYSGTAFKLMDKMWNVVKTAGLQNTGINIWVYEANDRVFAGVELLETVPEILGLEQKNITLKKYAYYKHTGSYSLIKSAGQSMRNELQSRGFTVDSPYIELYGHWTNNEAELETELIMALD